MGFFLLYDVVRTGLLLRPDMVAGAGQQRVLRWC
jgi:hypothetical protein